MVYNVALDLDQVVCFHHTQNTEQGKFFLETAEIRKIYNITHYFYPGAIPLVRRIALEANVRLTIYSAACSERNEALVSEMMLLALPESEHEEIRKSIRVLSQYDLAEDILPDYIFHHYTGIMQISEKQKDLNKVLHRGDKLENAVLVDDQSRNIAFLQTPNFLKVPVSSSEKYNKLLAKTEFYNETSGKRFLKCIFNIAGSPDLEKGMVEEGRRIFVYKNEESFGIKFLDISGRVRMVTITQEKYPNACKNLEIIHNNYQDKDQELVCLGQKITESICHYVSSQFEARAVKICRQANRICYVAGILFKALFQARSEGIALSAALWQLQYKMDTDNIYKPNFHRLQKEDLHYLYGLSMIQETTPDYQLITPHMYQKYTQMPISEQADELLQAAKQNEYQEKS